VISVYPNTEAGVISWKLLDFIESMEKQRAQLEQQKSSYFEKARQFYLLMDYRNSIKYFSIFMQEKPPDSLLYQAQYYKGRSHEEVGESEEAMAEYQKVIRGDKSREWAKQANRRMLMMGEFYEQKKQISDEAKRQLALYQDQSFINKVEQYASMVSESSLRKELMAGSAQNKEGKTVRAAADDSLLNVINQDRQPRSHRRKGGQAPGGTPETARRACTDRQAVGAGRKELERRKDLEDNPFRRPSVLKETIDENSTSSNTFTTETAPGHKNCPARWW